jgi:hypothetical protein
MILDDHQENMKINWTFVIMVFTYAARLAEECRRCSFYDSYKIIDATVSYLERDDIQIFIKTHGDWKEFCIRFHEDGDIEGLFIGLVQYLDYCSLIGASIF